MRLLVAHCLLILCQKHTRVLRVHWLCTQLCHSLVQHQLRLAQHDCTPSNTVCLCNGLTARFAACHGTVYLARCILHVLIDECSVHSRQKLTTQLMCHQETMSLPKFANPKMIPWHRTHVALTLHRNTKQKHWPSLKHRLSCIMSCMSCTLQQKPSGAMVSRRILMAYGSRHTICRQVYATSVCSLTARSSCSSNSLRSF